MAGRPTLNRLLVPSQPDPLRTRTRGHARYLTVSQSFSVLYVRLLARHRRRAPRRALAAQPRLDTARACLPTLAQAGSEPQRMCRRRESLPSGNARPPGLLLLQSLQLLRFQPHQVLL
jgi:hypothetical protein